MSLSTSRLAYSDIFEILEKALENPRGIRLSFPTLNYATHYRMRLNQARSIDRSENLDLYPEGEPLHGRSVYDGLTTSIVKDDTTWWLYIKPQVGPTLIEEIPPDATT